MQLKLKNLLISLLSYFTNDTAMPKHSRELLLGIHNLSKLNLNTHTAYHALSDLQVTQKQHPANQQISEIIDKINQKFSLSAVGQQNYRKQPLSYMGEGMVIGIHNSRGETYRIIRAEHYKEYTLLCKNLEKIGLTIYLLHDEYMDAVFS
ncbi:MAG: hypothetical protein methR_P1720 [Methyloprofundus sp.]|nr:MAG: hypothetical protein methR_P1720 [Methyloprofundus sp.]